jgi:hypothetical protein
MSLVRGCGVWMYRNLIEVLEKCIQPDESQRLEKTIFEFCIVPNGRRMDAVLPPSPVIPLTMRAWSVSVPRSARRHAELSRRELWRAGGRERRPEKDSLRIGEACNTVRPAYQMPQTSVEACDGGVALLQEGFIAYSAKGPPASLAPTVPIQILPSHTARVPTDTLPAAFSTQNRQSP